MSNIFPSDYGRDYVNTNISTTDVPMLKSYNVDTDTGEIIVDKNGNFEIVEGLEAIKVQSWILSNMRRDRWIICKDKGNKFKDFQGKDLPYLVRNIDEELTKTYVDGTYIQSVTVNSVTQEDDKAKVSFTINSIYGDYEEEEEII